MTAKSLDGKILSARVRTELAGAVGEIVAAGDRPPALDVILVGEDPASQVYVGSKEKACAKVGMTGRVHRLDTSTRAEELKVRIEEINRDPAIDGLLVQLPLPDQIDAGDVRSWIDPEKDVDGLHPENVGLLASGEPRFVPCTPAGCLELLRTAGVEIAGKRALVIGRSLIVGRPMAGLLSTKGIDATVTVFHSRSRDLASLCRESDIVIAAAGQPQFLRAEHVKPGAAVVDVGIHRMEDASAPKGYRLVGDVHPEVAEVAGWLSPVPGGVGPMTIAMLLRNTLDAYQRRSAR